MSVTLLRDDLETAATTLAAAGFAAIEVHLSHLGPGLPSSPISEGHAAAVGEMLRRRGLVVSTLNAVADETFDPFGGPAAMEATVDALALQLRLAHAMGSPRLLIWEGVADAAAVDKAPELLARCLDRARTRSGVVDPPAFSVECHPFTWGLEFHRLPELALLLGGVGSGICLDFCHFALGLGPRFIEALDPETLAAVNHLHYADTDAITPQLHFPPGRGVLDFDRIAKHLRGRGLAAAWDLFGWPGPRETVAKYLGDYSSFVDAINR